VCILKKNLYGLKQASRAWYGKINNFLIILGFIKNNANLNLYFKFLDDIPVIRLFYVDELFLTGVEKVISECKRKLAAKFEMKDLGMMHYIVGLEVWKRHDEIFLNQGKYAVEILKRFNMLDCMTMTTPMVSNMKFLQDTTSKTMDVTLYR
jgi:hypothetical protein